MRIYSMPERVVSDSSPLISLFLIERFSLLKDFCKQIIIPEAVWKEIIHAKKQGIQFFEQEREKKFTSHQNIRQVSLSKQLLTRSFLTSESIQKKCCLLMIFQGILTKLKQMESRPFFLLVLMI